VNLMQLRKFRYEDLPRILELERKCFGADAYPPATLLALAALYPELFIVAEERGEVVGYISAVVRQENVGHIVSICVDPLHRRRGVGTALMREVERILSEVFGVCTFRLEVRVSNTPAIKLYEKLGYRIVDRVENYYPDGEDGYVMLKFGCSKS